MEGGWLFQAMGVAWKGSESRDRDWDSVRDCKVVKVLAWQSLFKPQHHFLDDLEEEVIKPETAPECNCSPNPTPPNSMIWNTTGGFKAYFGWGVNVEGSWDQRLNLMCWTEKFDSILQKWSELFSREWTWDLEFEELIQGIIFGHYTAALSCFVTGEWSLHISVHGSRLAWHEIAIKC